jgi:hypothetical protein
MDWPNQLTDEATIERSQKYESYTWECWQKQINLVIHYPFQPHVRKGKAKKKTGKRDVGVRGAAYKCKDVEVTSDY